MQHTTISGNALASSSVLVRRQPDPPRQLHLSGAASRQYVSAGSAAGSALSTEQLSTEQPGVFLSAHPDAVRRRREADRR